MNGVVYASVEPAELIRRKYLVDLNTKGVVIGDGASWIESLRDEYFPQMWNLFRDTLVKAREGLQQGGRP
ncbi:MAG: hypothetical protein ABIM74_06780 [candidate division WOR-3 bacterium]